MRDLGPVRERELAAGEDLARELLQLADAGRHARGHHLRVVLLDLPVGIVLDLAEGRDRADLLREGQLELAFVEDAFEVPAQGQSSPGPPPEPFPLPPLEPLPPPPDPPPPDPPG